MSWPGNVMTDGSPDAEAAGCCSPGRRGSCSAWPGLGQLPPGDLPEVAFAGRSNVGKSNLIPAPGRAGGWRGPPARRGAPSRSISSSWTAGCASPTCRATATRRRSRWSKLEPADLRLSALAGQACSGRWTLVGAPVGLKATDEEAMAALGKAAVPFRIVLTRPTSSPHRSRRPRGRAGRRLHLAPTTMPEPVVTSATPAGAGRAAGGTGRYRRRPPAAAAGEPDVMSVPVCAVNWT